MNWFMGISTLIGAICAFLLAGDPDFWTAIKRQRWYLIRFILYFLLAAFATGVLKGAQTWRVSFLIGLITEAFVSLWLNRLARELAALQAQESSEERG